MNKPDRFWNWMAKRYDRHTHGDEGYAEAVARITEYLEGGDIVLDFACASGAIALQIAPHVAEVHGIDTSSRMIELGEKRAREARVANVTFARKTIFDHGLERASYDVVLAFNILHLLDDARQALERTSELLRPGGALISLTPCLGESGVILGSLVPFIRRVIGLSYLRRFRASEVEGMIENAGFRILESEVRGGKIQLCEIVARKPTLE